jgi:hypothetical protein
VAEGVTAPGGAIRGDRYCPAIVRIEDQERLGPKRLLNVGDLIEFLRGEFAFGVENGRPETRSAPDVTEISRFPAE